VTDARAIAEACFERRGSELWIEGVRVAEIAERFGTPLFVHSRRVMLARLARLRAALPGGFDVFYSIKANPTREILRVFLEAGCGLEVASGGELEQALVAGCRPERLLFAGPGKSESELAEALVRGIGEIHVESLDEIARLAAVARRAERVAAVAIRVNPLEEARGGAMQMGGRPSPFGIDEESLEPAVERIAGEPALRLCGVHLFAGTQILDAEVLLRQYHKAFEVGRRAARLSGGALGTLDFGGGLGIPYFAGERELDLEAFGRGLAERFAGERERPEFRGTRFVLEPGRYLVGESGIYVCRVNYVKRSRGKTFLIVDGGMHQHLAASGNLGQVLKRNFPVAPLTRLDAEPGEPVDVVGPLCTPLDVLARDVRMPAVEVGDLVGVFQSGAYARSASPLGFLSHAAPPEVLVESGSARLIRGRDERADLFQRQPDGRAGVQRHDGSR
jgi:diaminopimelate decarboxylase